MQQVNKANHHRKQNTNFIFLLGDTSETNNRRARQQQNVVKDGLSEVSAFAANVANNEKHHLLEFAMRYFGEGRKKFDFPSFSFLLLANQTFSGPLGNISWQIQATDVFHRLLRLQRRLRLRRGRLLRHPGVGEPSYC